MWSAMPSACQDAGDRGGNVLVFARDEARRHLDDCHLAAEAAVDLGELESDVAAADNDQVRRAGTRRRAGVLLVKYSTWSRPGISGTAARPPTLMKISGRAQGLAADRHRLRRGEACVPLIDGDHGIASQRLLDAAVGEAQHIVLARLDLPHVDGDGAWDRNAVISGAAGEMRGIGTRHQRLGRRAAGVDAGAAEAVALDDRHALARRLPGDVRATGRPGRCR